MITSELPVKKTLGTNSKKGVDVPPNAARPYS